MNIDKLISKLKDGNKRFLQNLKANQNNTDLIQKTSEKQTPFTIILSCIDSRVAPEIIFDQSIGDIFSVRIAGNFVNTDILGSMEFACKIAGVKLIVVLGHTSCGAIKGACDNVKLGNLTKMLKNIEPAINKVVLPKENRNSSNKEFITNVAIKNVELAAEKITKESTVLAEMQQKGEIKIQKVMYNIQNGEVNFF